MRDDFKIPTRRALASRAGQRCSNPSCRRATSKADPGNSENWLDLGVAGHITAASPGGPRYDPALTQQQRRSASNGIWLCHHCGKEVDSAASTYTVDTLRTWKAQAEACTARDAASTFDEIARLIADLEHVLTRISDFIQDRQDTSPLYGLVGAREAEWHDKTRDLMRHSTDTQTLWDASVAPLVADSLVRASGIIGDQHPSIAEARRVFSYARTNLLVMADMAEALEELRTHLLLR